MKEIILKQHIEARRVVRMRIPDDCTEQQSAEMLKKMSLNNNDLPNNVNVVIDWCYICDTGIENENGETVLPGEE